MIQVDTYRPLAEVLFFTENGNLVARATNDPKSKLDQDVVAITTVRDMQADSPTFTIDLTNRKPWNNWIAANDKVVISMSRPPEKLATVFIGLVDDTRKRVIVADNSVQRVITITGRSLAKAFIRFDVGVVPEAEYQSTTIGWLESAGVVLAGSKPGDIITAIWDKICIPHVNYKWADGSILFDSIKPVIKDRPDVMLLDSSSIMNWQGSLYALFKEVAEDPFYEIIWEMNDKGIEEMIVRATPFNQDDWMALPRINITDLEIVNDDTGISDVETYTIFSVGAKSLFSPEDTYKTFGVLPYWYKPYADKYGNNRLHVETAYTSVANSTDAGVQTDTMRNLMKDLYNWNIMNNSMKNGTMIVKGSNAYKVGTRLLVNSAEDNSGMEYYITAVTHNFVNFGAWTTTLGLTRGLMPSRRFIPPWGSYKEYSGMGIVPFDPTAARQALEVNPGISGTINFESANAVVGGAEDIMNHGIMGKFVHYTFGGNDPFAGRLDCSSFTQYVYQTYAHIDIGRTTGQQVTKGVKVSKDQAMPGDLVLFAGTYNSQMLYGASHVGIYIGNDQFINNNETGNVCISSLKIPYWSQHFLMFRRVLTDTQNVNASTQPVNYGGTMPSGGSSTFQATAYGANPVNLMGGAGWVATGKTATGTTPKEGRTIAVDPSVIPLYSLVKIECPDFPSINGSGYVAEDTGGAIKGNKIDIYFDDSTDPTFARTRMLNFGRRNVQVTILRKGKG